MSLPSSQLSGGCAAKATIDVKPRIVSVNGETIARADIARETQNHPAADPASAWRAAARALAIKALLLQEARRLGLKPEPRQQDGRRETKDEALARALIEREIAPPRADETECRRYFENNREKFRSPALFEARHILFAAVAGSPARAAAKIAAQRLLAQALAAPETFGALAGAVSACPSREKGGVLGWIGSGATTPELERVLARMDIGTIHAEPIETRYGWHLLALDQRVEGSDLPFASVRMHIAQWLEERVRRLMIADYLSQLAEGSKIVGVDLNRKQAL